jgi:hypothetical protein
MPIKTTSTPDLTDLERVTLQLQQVNPNDMIMVIAQDQKKHKFEYLSHTQDTLTAILHHKIPHNSYMVNKIEMKMALNTMSEVKVEKINYPLSIGVPAAILIGGVVIFINNATFDVGW